MRKSLKKNPVVGNLFCNWYCCNKFILAGEWLKFDMCTVNTRDIIEHLLDWAIKIQYTMLRLMVIYLTWMSNYHFRCYSSFNVKSQMVRWV